MDGELGMDLAETAGSFVVAAVAALARGDDGRSMAIARGLTDGWGLESERGCDCTVMPRGAGMRRCPARAMSTSCCTTTAMFLNKRRDSIAPTPSVDVCVGEFIQKKASN